MFQNIISALFFNGGTFRTDKEAALHLLLFPVVTVSLRHASYTAGGAVSENV